MTITGTKWEKFTHYAKVVTVTALVFTAIGGIAYGKVTKYVSDQKQANLIEQINLLKVQVVEAKK